MQFISEVFFAILELVPLFIGLMFILLGIGFIHRHRSFKKAAYRVQARVIGLRVNNKKSIHDEDVHPTYYLVIEYTALNGRLQQADCYIGSYNNLKYKPGSTIEVFIHPDKPKIFRLYDNIDLSIGIFMLITGCVPVYLSLRDFEFSPLTPVVALALILWGWIKVKKFINQKGIWESFNGYIESKAIEFSDNRENMEFLDTASVKVLSDKKERNSKLWAPFFFLISIGLIFTGVHFGKNMAQRLQNDPRAEGTVTGFEENCSDGCTYAPIVDFFTTDGRSITFTDKVSTSHPQEKRGDTVTVIYRENDPEDAILDRGYWNWLLPGIMVFIGCLIFLSVLIQMRSFNQANKRI